MKTFFFSEDDIWIDWIKMEFDKFADNGKLSAENFEKSLALNKVSLEKTDTYKICVQAFL